MWNSQLYARCGPDPEFLLQLMQDALTSPTGPYQGGSVLSLFTQSSPSSLGNDYLIVRKPATPDNVVPVFDGWCKRHAHSLSPKLADEHRPLVCVCVCTQAFREQASNPSDPRTLQETNWSSIAAAGGANLGYVFKWCQHLSEACTLRAGQAQLERSIGRTQVRDILVCPQVVLQRDNMLRKRVLRRQRVRRLPRSSQRACRHPM
jgi:hypothetical protein